jgi:hypothetical protein
MPSLKNKIHVVPAKSTPTVIDRKYVSRSDFMAEVPRCPQCGSKTFTVYGCAISGLQRIYEDGWPAITTPADVTLKDYGLYWPDSLEGNGCGMTTYFQ